MSVIKAIVKLLRTTDVSELQSKLKDKEVGGVSGSPIIEWNDNGTYRRLLVKAQEASILTLFKTGTVSSGAGGAHTSPSAVATSDKSIIVVTPTSSTNAYYALAAEATAGKHLVVVNAGAVSAMIGDQSDINTGRFKEVPAKCQAIFESYGSKWVPDKDDGVYFAWNGGTNVSPKQIDVTGLRKIIFLPASSDYYTLANAVEGQQIELVNIHQTGNPAYITNTAPDIVVWGGEQNFIRYLSGAYTEIRRYGMLSGEGGVNPAAAVDLSVRYARTIFLNFATNAPHFDLTNGVDGVPLLIVNKNSTYIAFIGEDAKMHGGARVQIAVDEMKWFIYCKADDEWRHTTDIS
jgi:hypothetical protein